MAKNKKLSTVQSNPLVINTSGITTGMAVTSTYTNGTSLIYNGLSTTLTPIKSKYIVLGKEIEVEGSKDFNVASCVSLINTIGIKFYIELKKQDINFPKEIENFLEKEVVSYYRNKTIDEIIK